MKSANSSAAIMPDSILALGKLAARVAGRLPYAGKILHRGRNRARTQLLQFMPKQSVCAEIGVWKGSFSQRILHIVRPRELFLIDPWLFQSAGTDQWYGGHKGHATSQAAMDAIYREVGERFVNVPEVSILREFSSDAASLFDNGYFDWIYIDGNHSFEHIKADLEAYLPKIKRLGYLTGDDYLWRPDNGFPVKKAIEQVVHARLVRLLSVRRGQWILQKV